MTQPHILVTTDLSNDAASAYGPAADLATRMGARVSLVSIVQEVPAIPHGAPLAPPLGDPALPQRMREAEAAVEVQCQQFPGGLKVTTRVIAAPKVVEAILACAAEVEATMLVIASRGWGGIRGMLLGSVAEGVLRKATLPVLMVPVATERPTPVS